MSNPEQKIIRSNYYEVLTENGYINFDGIVKTFNQKTIKIKVNENNLICTPKHQIKIDNNFVNAETQEHEKHPNCDVYDLINVEQIHHYLTNDITSHNCLVIDECAHAENWDAFYASVYPTIAEYKESKIIMSSTPNGLNHFHKFWVESEQGKNDFKRFFVTWDMVPGRDEAWRKDALAALSFDEEKFDQEFNCSFLGSSGTLISGQKLKQMVAQIPLVYHDGLSQFKLPEKGHKYAISCDVSHGKGFDYSAFHVIDVTSMPYEQVCVFHSNRITPTDYAHIIFSTATNYNEALMLIEVNDIGVQVADVIQWDHGYENLIMTVSEGNKKIVVSGFGGRNSIVDKGVRTTLPLKNTGCALIKLLIEQNQLIINHDKTIHEFSTFSKKNKSYEAEEGKHDDLVMGLVLFAWLTGQQYFKDYTDIDPMAFLRDKTDDELYDELVPFGFIDRGGEPEYTQTNEAPPVRDMTQEMLHTFDLDIESIKTGGNNWKW